MATLSTETTVVRDMIDGALESCAKKLGLPSGEHVKRMMGTGNCAICDSLCHGLAEKVAAYLGAADAKVKAVYSYDPEYATSGDCPVPGRPRLSPAINLLAWVSGKSEALPDVIESLGEALGTEYRRYACKDARVPCYQLDVQVADDADVRARRGYGALIDSIHVRPIELWRR